MANGGWRMGNDTMARRLLIIIALGALMLVAAKMPQGGVGNAEPWGQLVSLGVGGIIAGIVLYWKRQDDKMYQSAQAEFASRLERINDRVLALLESKTRSEAELIAAVRDLRFRLAERLEKLEGLDATESH
jgi:hypothetical protein